MRNNRVLSLFSAICLIFVVAVLAFVPACSKPASLPTPPTTPAAITKPVYTVLDPRSYEPEVHYQGLSPRLDTLKDKKVGIINMRGAGAEIMETIGLDLEAAVPGCTTMYREVGHEPGAIEGLKEFINSCDAIILGHNY